MSKRSDRLQQAFLDLIRLSGGCGEGDRDRGKKRAIAAYHCQNVYGKLLTPPDGEASKFGACDRSFHTFELLLSHSQFFQQL